MKNPRVKKKRSALCRRRGKRHVQNRLPSPRAPYKYPFSHHYPLPSDQTITHHTHTTAAEAAAGASATLRQDPEHSPAQGNPSRRHNAGRRRLRQALRGRGHHRKAGVIQAPPPPSLSPPRRRWPPASLRLRAAALPPGTCPRDRGRGGGPQRPRLLPRAAVRHRGRRPPGGGDRRAGGGAGRGRAAHQDRGLLRHVVGAERDLQHLQQEDAQRVPLPVARGHALPRRRLRHHARVLGHQDRRAAADGPRFLEVALPGGDRAHDRARRGDGEHGQGGRVVHAHHQERGAGVQRARLQVLPRRALPGAGLLLAPPHHRRMRTRRRHRAQLQHGWIYGGNDLQRRIRLPEHLLQEGDEGQVRQRDELLCLPLHDVFGDPPPLRHRHGGAQGVGSRLAESSRRDRSQLRLVGGGAECVLPPLQPSILHVVGRDFAADIQHWQHNEEDFCHCRLHHYLPNARSTHQRARSRYRHSWNLHLLFCKAVMPWNLDGLSSPWIDSVLEHNNL